MEPPRFARHLANKVEADENEPVHFEARLQPASDVKMVVEWYTFDNVLFFLFIFKDWLEDLALGLLYFSSAYLTAPVILYSKNRYFIKMSKLGVV